MNESAAKTIIQEIEQKEREYVREQIRRLCREHPIDFFDPEVRENMGQALARRKPVKAAVYCLLQSDLDAARVLRLCEHCYENAWYPNKYLDIQRRGENLPQWTKLLEDIAQGKIDVVVMYQSAPGLESYCQQYGARVEKVKFFVD